MTDVYNPQENYFLREAKNLVPRIITYNGNVSSFCLIENGKNEIYYCFLSLFGFSDRDKFMSGDVVTKMTLEDYFKTSNRLRNLNLKFNLRKIIYDSNRNK